MCLTNTSLNDHVAQKLNKLNCCLFFLFSFFISCFSLHCGAWISCERIVSRCIFSREGVPVGISTGSVLTLVHRFFWAGCPDWVSLAGFFPFLRFIPSVFPRRRIEIRVIISTSGDHQKENVNTERAWGFPAPCVVHAMCCGLAAICRGRENKQKTTRKGSTILRL